MSKYGVDVYEIVPQRRHRSKTTHMIRFTYFFVVNIINSIIIRIVCSTHSKTIKLNINKPNHNYNCIRHRLSGMLFYVVFVFPSFNCIHRLTQFCIRLSVNTMGLKRSLRRPSFFLHWLNDSCISTCLTSSLCLKIPLIFGFRMCTLLTVLSACVLNTLPV